MLEPTEGETVPELAMTGWELFQEHRGHREPIVPLMSSEESNG